jgi:UPF0176 protein
MFLNISTYRFCELDHLEDLREQILAQCNFKNLKGTILLAPEGINMFLAGDEADIRDFFLWLNQFPALQNIVTKDSWSEYQPFKKMLVKVKDEIIRMNHPTIQAFKKRAPSIPAKKLKEWLARGTDDDGKPIVLLDTRNAFEVEYGTFVGAIHFHLEKFSEFPQAITKQAQSLKDKTIVTFCTGGIRCEKANLLMQEIGLNNTLQLDGGILKYFEEVGQDFYEGGCFVFDDRIALDPELSEHPLENAPRRHHSTSN